MSVSPCSEPPRGAGERAPRLAYLTFPGDHEPLGPATAPPGYGVGVLEKAIDVLEALVSGGRMGLTELSQATKANKTTVYRILNTLEHRGIVAKDSETRKYFAGRRLIALSSSLIDELDLVRLARPALARLRDEFYATVNLAVLTGDAIQYLDILEPGRGAEATATAGSRAYLHSTALGKALLSRMPARQAIRTLQAVDRPRLTRSTLTSVESLMDELRRTRERGYAVDNEETEPGFVCVAVPVVGSEGAPLAAVSVTTPASRVDAETIHEIAPRVRHVARAVAARASH